MLDISSITWEQAQAMAEMGLKPEQVIADLQKDGIDINYGHFRITVSPNAIIDGKQMWAETTPIDVVYIERALKKRIEKSIVKLEKREENGKWPPKKFMDDLTWDLVLWHTRPDPEGSYCVISLTCGPTGEQFIRSIKSCFKDMSAKELMTKPNTEEVK
jgi:hypothetical protein